MKIISIVKQLVSIFATAPPFISGQLLERNDNEPQGNDIKTEKDEKNDNSESGDVQQVHKKDTGC